MGLTGLTFAFVGQAEAIDVSLWAGPVNLRIPKSKIFQLQRLSRLVVRRDANEPHLHFEVTTSSKLLAGEGVPYLIDRYRCKSAGDGPTELYIHQLPLGKSVVIFGEDRDKR